MYFPIALGGGFPYVKSVFASQQAWLLDCAVFLAFLFAYPGDESSSLIAMFFGPSSRAASMDWLRNFLTEQTSDVHVGGMRDCKSGMGFSLALPLICFVWIGVLFTFVSRLDIVAFEENFPLLTNCNAS